MSGHLCLKWNNHSTAFIKSISNIQIKERYCDATIACQGKYFPVHRVVLSTCSDYFDEMFERIQNPHPYIVFKDIEPREMELLLNYMYQGEVNVVQENLPTLIKAAEALKVKGLAVPDDLPSNKESSGRKRGNSSNDVPVPKRRSEEKRRRRDSSDQTPHPSTSSSGHDRESSRLDHSIDHIESKLIKEEPLDTGYNDPPLSTDYGEAAYSGGDSAPDTNPANSSDKTEGVYANFPLPEESEPYVKQEESVPTDSFNDEQASSWSDFASGDIMQDLPETSGQDDIHEMNVIYQSALSATTIHSFKERNSIASYGPTPTKSLRGHHCPYCEYKSTTPFNVRKHIRCRHTGERPFRCHLCQKLFTDKCGLQVHLRTHTGEKPYKCNVCRKTFAQSGHVSAHMKTVHGANK